MAPIRILFGSVSTKSCSEMRSNAKSMALAAKKPRAFTFGGNCKIQNRDGGFVIIKLIPVWAEAYSSMQDNNKKAIRGWGGCARPSVAGNH